MKDVAAFYTQDKARTFLFVRKMTTDEVPEDLKGDGRPLWDLYQERWWYLPRSRR
jgi:uncharacterized membrane protein